MPIQILAANIQNQLWVAPNRKAISEHGFYGCVDHNYQNLYLMKQCGIDIPAVLKNERVNPNSEKMF